MDDNSNDHELEFSAEELGEIEKTDEITKKSDSLAFLGNGGDYFKIWIVNIFLTIVTFGIYSAWAKVRTKKYIMQMTEFRGARFDYHASPIPILKGRIIAALIFIAYAYGGLINPLLGMVTAILLLLAFPIIVTKSFKFNAKNTSYQNIRFRFGGKIKDAYKLVLKYFSFPVLLSASLTIFSYFMGYSMEYVEGSTEMPKGVVFSGAGGVISFIYIVFMSPRIINDLLQFFYSNSYYGGVKVNLRSTNTEIRKQILTPYFLTIFGGVFISILLMFVLAFIAQPLIFLGGIFFYLFVIVASLALPFLMIKYLWSNLECEFGESKNTMIFIDFLKLNILNFFLTGLTFGLYYPWAKVELLKYKNKHKVLNLEPLDKISAVSEERESAVLEEVADAFDFDFDFGL